MGTEVAEVLIWRIDTGGNLPSDITLASVSALQLPVGGMERWESESVR